MLSKLNNNYFIAKYFLIVQKHLLILFQIEELTLKTENQSLADFCLMF